MPLLELRNETRATVVAGRVREARSLWARFRGLMGRASLERDAGLWFPGTGSIHMLFMRFPIDCVFLSAADPAGRRRVVAIRAGLPAWRGLVLPIRGSGGVVELAAGALAASGTVVGDELDLRPAAYG